MNYNCDVNCDVEKYTEVCDKLYSKNTCDKVGDKRDMSTTVDWEDILNTMEKCCSCDELKRYVLGLKLPTLPNQFKGLQQMRCDKRDVLTFTFLPKDIGIDKSELFPVATSGYGSCFYYSLSRLVYGDELHSVEMRVRVVHEGIVNMNLYLDHEYLCWGHSFDYRSENDIRRIYASFCSFYRHGMSLDDGSIENYYKMEMFNVRCRNEYSGIWQFHQAANVLKCKVQSVYPHTEVQIVRKELNRVILPMDLESVNCDELVRIMWTKGSGVGSGYNHFVPLVKKVSMFDAADVNLSEVEKI